jgi:hypothetical protein
VLYFIAVLIIWSGNFRFDWFVIIASISTIAIVVMLLLKGDKARSDLDDKISAVEGFVTLDIIGETYAIYIDGSKFDVYKEAFLAFKNGDPYRIYLAPNSNKILSAEWLYDVQDDNYLEDENNDQEIVTPSISVDAGRRSGAE